jgi:hypothetical protein
MKTVTAFAAAAALLAGASAHATEAVPAEALAVRPPAAAPAAAAGFHMAPLDTYAEVLRRPLFEPDRRAHEAPQAAAAAEQPFVLRGIVVQPGASYALIEEGKTSKRVTEGQALAGGTVTKILRDRVVLNINGVDTAVKLFDPTANGKSTPGLSTAGGIPSQLPPDYQPSVPVSRPSLSGG